MSFLGDFSLFDVLPRLTGIWGTLSPCVEPSRSHHDPNRALPRCDCCPPWDDVPPVDPSKLASSHVDVSGHRRRSIRVRSIFAFGRNVLRQQCLSLLDEHLGRLAKPPPPSPDLFTWLETAKSSKIQEDAYRDMENATCYKEWNRAASALDEVEGHNIWKNTLESDEYDYLLVKSRLDQLAAARAANDFDRMVFLIRTSLMRHLGKMGNRCLYSHSHTGSKQLIADYLDEVRNTLDDIVVGADSSQPNREPRMILDQIAAAAQAFGCSALLLSGGGTLGMTHIGVVKALWEEGMLPRIISGTSAGSIVAAVLCSKTDAEIPYAIDALTKGELDVFVKEGTNEGSLSAVLSRFFNDGYVFPVENLQRVMTNILGNMTFQEAYNRTRRTLNITVSSQGLYELPRLLNYVTSPDVVIWSAVAASCSVPYVFAPASLQAKDPRTGKVRPWNSTEHKWIDGSVDNDVPITRLAELFNINHFVVSQVNPHISPFLTIQESSNSPPWWQAFGSSALTEVRHRLQMLSELGVYPTACTKLHSVLNQRYSGDITILPPFHPSQLLMILRNPTPEFMANSISVGQRITWPKLSQIQNQMAIESALGQTIQRLRALNVCSSCSNPRQQPQPTRPLALATVRSDCGRLSGGGHGYTAAYVTRGGRITRRRLTTSSTAPSRGSRYSALIDADSLSRAARQVISEERYQSPRMARSGSRHRYPTRRVLSSAVSDTRSLDSGGDDDEMEVDEDGQPRLIVGSSAETKVEFAEPFGRHRSYSLDDHRSGAGAGYHSDGGGDDGGAEYYYGEDEVSFFGPPGGGAGGEVDREMIGTDEEGDWESADGYWARDVGAGGAYETTPDLDCFYEDDEVLNLRRASRSSSR